MGKRLESRTGVLAGVRSRLRDLTLPTTSYSTAVQRGSAVRGDLSVKSEAQGRKGTEQEGHQEEVEVVVRSGVGGSASVLRSSMDLNYLVSKMKPLFGADKTSRGREGDWNSSSRASCNSGQNTSKNMTLVNSSSSSGSSSRTAHSIQKNTQQKSSSTKSTYDVCVSDATYVRTDAEGSVTLLISLTFQNISM